MLIEYSIVLGNGWEDVDAVRTVPVMEKRDNRMLDQPPEGPPHVLAGESMLSCLARGPPDCGNGFSPRDSVRTTGLIYCPHLAGSDGSAGLPQP